MLFDFMKKYGRNFFDKRTCPSSSIRSLEGCTLISCRQDVNYLWIKYATDENISSAYNKVLNSRCLPARKQLNTLKRSAVKALNVGQSTANTVCKRLYRVCKTVNPTVRIYWGKNMSAKSRARAMHALSSTKIQSDIKTLESGNYQNWNALIHAAATLATSYTFRLFWVFKAWRSS